MVEGQRLNPPPPRIGKRGRPKLGPAAALLARLDRHRDDVLRLTSDFRVPFDNNQAERDVRMVKPQQKISGGRRSESGAQAWQAAAPGGAQRSREGSWSGFRRRVAG
ncbi:MAG TPA: transposase [Nakamurella sp.]|nr:transposase [Nakamurella sp.]